MTVNIYNSANMPSTHYFFEKGKDDATKQIYCPPPIKSRRDGNSLLAARAAYDRGHVKQSRLVA